MYHSDVTSDLSTITYLFEKIQTYTIDISSKHYKNFMYPYPSLAHLNNRLPRIHTKETVNLKNERIDD